MSGRFFVKLDVVPHPKDDRVSAKHFHVVCTACQGVLETIKSLHASEHEIRLAEAHQIADSMEFCEACGVGAPVPHVAEAALDVAQIN